jgi:D-glycero-alpha-D-manno-heptose-7-phosphate kinase
MIITRTPFRVSFFGGGTDYPGWFRKNGGSVLATSIDKYCYLTVRHLPPFFEHKHRIVYSQIENAREVKEIKHPVVRALLDEYDSDKGFEIHHDGDLPARSGLGSSSAFTVGLIHALQALKGLRVTKRNLADEAIRIEQDVLKENVGCQDQVTTAFGGLNRIDFSDLNNFDVSPVMLPRERLEELQNSLVLCFSGLSRYSSDIAAEQIRNMSERKIELQTLHSMVDDAIDILQNPNESLVRFGKLLHEGWLLKRSLSSSVSTAKIDQIYAAARDAGAIGGKVLGAGGGGFMLFFVPPEKRVNLLSKLEGLTTLDLRFESGGSRVLVYEPDDMEHV